MLASDAFINASYTMVSSGLLQNIPHIHIRLKARVYARKYKGKVGYSAVSHEKSLYNYFIPRHRKFRRKSSARDASWKYWVVYRRIPTFLHSDWLTFLWRGMYTTMLSHFRNCSQTSRSGYSNLRNEFIPDCGT